MSVLSSTAPFPSIYNFSLDQTPALNVLELLVILLTHILRKLTNPETFLKANNYFFIQHTHTRKYIDKNDCPSRSTKCTDNEPLENKQKKKILAYNMLSFLNVEVIDLIDHILTVLSDRMGSGKSFCL